MNGFEISCGSDRVLKVGVTDLLGVKVDAIFNPANAGLSHGGGIAAQISAAAGKTFDRHCAQIVKRLGRIPVGQAVISTAGSLPCKGVIHGVGPRMGDGDEGLKIEQTMTSCLKKASGKGWKSLALPAISAGLFCVPAKTCALAWKRALARFWRLHPDTSVRLIRLCLTVDVYPEFEAVLRPYRNG
jgi:O-acetyl-ADP-ribose deacetylase (regulator of RNase III)